MSENKANSLWLRALGRKILALKILTKYIYISEALHKKIFVVISPRVLNSYSSNIQDIFFCQTDINIYKHVSISYASRWERQMVFMEFDWKMTHTSFFPKVRNPPCAHVVVTGNLNTNQIIFKFKTLQVGKNRAKPRVQSQLHQTIFGGSIEIRKQGTFSLFKYQKLTSPTTCDQGLHE